MSAVEVKLKFSSWSPPASAYTLLYTWWMDEVENRTEGAVRFERYWDAGLIPFGREVELTSEGAADLSTFGAMAPEMPLTSVTTIHGVVTDLWAGMKAAKELAQLPPLQSELTDHNLKMVSTWGSTSYHVWTKDPVTGLADLDGRKLFALPNDESTARTFGATPVALLPHELADGFVNGALDGAICNVSEAAAYGFDRYVRYLLPIDLGGIAAGIVCNLERWNTLSPQVQKVIVEVSDELIPRYAQTFQDDGEAWMTNKFLAQGGQVVALSDADKAQIQSSVVVPTWDRWIQARADQGLPAREVLETWVQLNQQWRQRSPFIGGDDHRRD